MKIYNTRTIAALFSIILLNITTTCGHTITQTPSHHDIVEFFVIISLFVMGVHNTVVYAMRPSDRTPMWFGLFCLLISINVLISGGGFIGWFLPGLPFYLSHKIDIITLMLSMPCFIRFLDHFFPAERKKIVSRSIGILSLCFAFIVVVVPQVVYEILFRVYYGVIFVSICYSIGISIAAWRNRTIDSAGIMTGILIMSIAGINDLLWGSGYITTIILVPYATFLFALLYSALLSRRFAHAFSAAEKLAHQIVENQRLQGEMKRRIDQEHHLRLTQRRLTALLHVVEDPLCVVNDTNIITFCNRAFEELSGLRSDSVIGKPFPPSGDMAVDIKNSLSLPLELEDEQLSVILFKNRTTESRQLLPSRSFIETLNTNRQRVQRLEELLESTSHQSIGTQPQLAHELSMIDAALEHMGQALGGDATSEKKKQLGSKVLNLAISYWTECSGKSKFDLAAESRLWTVQVNQDGWERTQTLDRYLAPKTFPKNPRWNHILKTADFVLASCTGTSSLRKELEKHLQELLLIS